MTLRWLIQQPGGRGDSEGFVAERLRENLAILAFELAEAEMRALSMLGRNLRLVDAGWAPDSDAR